MVLKNKQLKQLSDILTQTDPNKRIAVYYGAGHVIASHLTDENKADPIMKIKAMLNRVCELTIIDRTLLTSITNNLYKLLNQTGKDRLDNVMYAKTFDDVLLINKYIGAGHIEAIDAHMQLFKTTTAYVKQVMQSYIDED